MKQNITKRLNVYFYKEMSGKEPVKEWLQELSKEDKKIIGDDIFVIQYNWPMGKPLVEYLTKGLWEVRTTLDNRIARIIFIVDKKSMVLLNGFIKKTQSTPPNEIDIALKRIKKYKEQQREL
jgi:phage-related protein